MKKIFLLLILFGVSIVNAQKYTFNTLTRYSFNSGGEVVSYTNFDNHTYVLRLIKTEYSFMANLYDYKSMRIHRFNVTETKSKEGFLLKFDYDNSTNLISSSRREFKKYIYDFKTIEIKDSIKKVTLNIYSNSKKKKSIRSYDLEIKNSNDNHFPVFRQSCIHPYEDVEKLNTFENGIVISAKGKTTTGEIPLFKLEEYVKVDFELDIPK
ncbi:hypothetical protein [Flavobacterium terrisoli]|uniref:hypothetical protein n=1 Tax=Flavobacterium terrisoli TaxID=3242195 RepID=UPI00254308CB|nr:hypothetical protein [Flavobacterium buctense]